MKTWEDTHCIIMNENYHRFSDFHRQKLKRRKATCEYETGLNWMNSKVSFVRCRGWKIFFVKFQIFREHTAIQNSLGSNDFLCDTQFVTDIKKAVSYFTNWWCRSYQLNAVLENENVTFATNADKFVEERVPLMERIPHTIHWYRSRLSTAIKFVSFQIFEKDIGRYLWRLLSNISEGIWWQLNPQLLTTGQRSSIEIYLKTLPMKRLSKLEIELKSSVEEKMIVAWISSPLPSPFKVLILIIQRV